MNSTLSYSSPGQSLLTASVPILGDLGQTVAVTVSVAAPGILSAPIASTVAIGLKPACGTLQARPPRLHACTGNPLDAALVCVGGKMRFPVAAART